MATARCSVVMTNRQNSPSQAPEQHGGEVRWFHERTAFAKSLRCVAKEGVFLPPLPPPRLPVFSPGGATRPCMSVPRVRRACGCLRDRQRPGKH